MQIENRERYDRFMDAVKLILILWRRSGNGDLSEIAAKLDISERTVRRRFHSPETLTLGELFVWCESCGKDLSELLLAACREADRQPDAPEHSDLLA